MKLDTLILFVLAAALTVLAVRALEPQTPLILRTSPIYMDEIPPVSLYFDHEGNDVRNVI